MFPFPPVVNDLVKKLPPPNSFLGPFVIIDKLIKLFQEADYAEGDTIKLAVCFLLKSVKK
jgi:hypothetical protein